MPDRIANTVWHGDLFSGSGTITLASSYAQRFSFSLSSRADDEKGQTNPEELVAAAHSACYSMQLAALLSDAGTPPESIQTEATVSQNLRGGEYLISRITLRVQAVVPGVDDEAFQVVARKAKESCPVSQALSGTEISLDASLARLGDAPVPP